MKQILSSLLFTGFLLILQPSCAQQREIVTGAGQTGRYLPLLSGKRIAVMANQSSRVGKAHLVDTLLSLKADLRKIFAPEHGFRGDAGAGEPVRDGTDPVSGLPVISLYGDRKKPSPTDLEGVDMVIFDIQDVGVRFYTYISSLHYLMEACAEQGVDVLILDRPNPNGFYIDGPVLLPEHSSFVGMHPVPMVHGMTIGEYGRMINGEGWLREGISCSLQVIQCQNYTHRSFYELPVAPSPNLPNMPAVYLYPSLGLFEGTVISVGRGTEVPFQVFGHPSFKEFEYSFTPVSTPGKSLNPPYEGQTCLGVDLSAVPVSFLRNNAQIVLDWLIEAYGSFRDKENFFNPYFTKLAGTPDLQAQLMAGKDPYQIRYSWQEGIKAFKKTRKKYLLYPDFE